MPQLLLVTANLFIFIVCLVGVQSCYFRARWRWFWLMLACVILSGACASFEFYQWAAQRHSDVPIYVHVPTSPL